MSKEAGFMNLSIKNILSDEQSMLTQARIRLLYYGMWLVFASVFAVFVSVFFMHQLSLVIIACSVLVMITSLFKYLTWKGWLS